MDVVIYNDLKVAKRDDRSQFKTAVDLVFEDGSRITVFDPDKVLKTE